MLKYMKVAWKHIKEYKKRSIAIVLSIMLSVFLVVTIGSLSESARVLQVDDIIQNTGRNHVFYNGLGKAQIDKISKEKNVKEVANSFNYGTWKSNNGVNVDILAGEKKLLYMLDTEIIEGKYPTESNEIAIEGWVLDRLRLPHELNKNIKLSSKENGEKEFKLVGIIENRLHSQNHDFRNAFVAFDDEKIVGREDSIETLVEFKEGLKYKNEAMKLGKAIGIKDEEKIVLNRELLDAMGELKAIDWDLVKTSLLLIVVGGMVIYSLYSISVLKRVQEYGTMRAICSTKNK
ncbi:ABC transporter permease [Anaerosalibacter bizertensis]|uniref:ABC transporter permease n=1 Tax=Anaerosalibacter bizertensis TaxID=932217 RepID=UPI001D018E56|nr:ABC transporter permease [Anaerosalibacter bizertensis]MCB5560398.1 ABC transporter permease [Anaerosalibacter bizertensis]MCG4585618.1 ABC transporter permease [Anaerosalibacter bizertensis]